MEYILGFVLLLGVLVFIHEYGHYIVAKAFGIRVETFSIGMGKKIISFRKGETEYALSLIPLGGYVKLTGQDTREVVPPELLSRSFHEKPLYQRAAVVMAGPLFNAVLAVGVFVFLYAVGVPSPAPSLERVLTSSSAFKAGFRTGDRIESIINQDSKVWQTLEATDLERRVGDAVDEPLTFNVVRENALFGIAPQKIQIRYTPVLGWDRDSTIGVLKQRGIIEGTERSAAAPAIVVNKATWLAERLFPSPFYVNSVEWNGKVFQLRTLNDLEMMWSKVSTEKGSEGSLIVKGHTIRMEDESVANIAGANKSTAEDSAEETYTLAWSPTTTPFPETLLKAGGLSTELIVTNIVPNSPAEKLGLRAGDLLVNLNDAPIESFNSFKQRLQEVAQSGEPVRISWLRAGELQNSEIKPAIVTSEDPLTEVKRKQFQIGGAFMALPASPNLVTVKAHSPGEALHLGWDRTVRLTGSMLSSFYHLAAGDISPKTLGGPILIAKISGESMKQGYVAFLRMMAFISLNLFILNLLPIPVLDGGHLLLYCIEAIRRRPVSPKIVEAWTTAGFFLLMGLVAVVFFNDLSRLGLFKFFTKT